MPENPDSLNLERLVERAYAAVGKSILAWAQVEHEMALLWRELCGSRDQIADAVWDRVKSFDVKSKLVNDLATRKLLPRMLGDWKLIHPYVERMYSEDNTAVRIVPFFSLQKETHHLFTACNTDAIAEQQLRLRETLQWFSRGIRASETQRQLWQAQAPDLVLHLRAADAPKREAQRHRALAWRQYLDRNPNLKL